MKPCQIITLVLVVVLLIILFGFKVTISRNTKNYNITATNSKLGGLRPSCLMCVRKHIAKAQILLTEAELGYPAHFWIALGNLSEAEDESIKDYPELSKKIREARLIIQDGGNVDLTTFYQLIDSYSQQK